MSRVTATLGVPPRQTTLAGTRCAAAAARVLMPSTTQRVPSARGGEMRGAWEEEMRPKGEHCGLTGTFISGSHCCAGVRWMDRQVPARDLAGDSVNPYPNGFPCFPHLGGVCRLGKTCDDGSEAGPETAETSAWVQSVGAVYGIVCEHRQRYSVSWQMLGEGAQVLSQPRPGRGGSCRCGDEPGRLFSGPCLGYSWDGIYEFLRQHLVVSAKACQPEVNGRLSLGSRRDAYQPTETGARLGHVELVEQPEQAGGCGRFGQRFRTAAAPQVRAAGKPAQIPLSQVQATDGGRCLRWGADPYLVVSQLTAAVDSVAPAAVGSRHLLDGRVCG